MPIYELYCENCGTVIEYFASFEEAQGELAVDCETCGKPLKRDWSGNSISGSVSGGTGGGAGMGIVQKMPKIERKKK